MTSKTAPATPVATPSFFTNLFAEIHPKVILNDTKDLLRSLMPVKKKKDQAITTVEVYTVNTSWFKDDIIPFHKEHKVTVIYDKESLDSLFALSFMVHLYGDKVQPVAVQNVTLDRSLIHASSTTWVLGVDLSLEDLQWLDCHTQRTFVLGYQGYHQYLYEKKNGYLFNHVTMFISAHASTLCGKYGSGLNIDKYENTLAAMVKTLFFDHTAFKTWRQSSWVKHVAHASAMYVPVPDYGLSVSTLNKSYVTVASRDETEPTKQKSVGHLSNDKAPVMLNLRNILEEATVDKSKFLSMPTLTPVMKMTDYAVRHRRLKEHIENTFTKQSWVIPDSGWMKPQSWVTYTVPVMSADVNDIVQMCTGNQDTIVGVEDSGECINYYVFSRNEVALEDIIGSIKGEKRWMRGLIHCVSKRKSINATR